MADIVALIDQGADLHPKGSDKDTPLHNASLNGHAEVAKALLAKGADVHAKASDGHTPQHMACSNCHAEMAKALLDGGADADAIDRDGYSPHFYDDHDIFNPLQVERLRRRHVRLKCYTDYDTGLTTHGKVRISE